MRKIRKGDKAIITKPVIIRRTNGTVDVLDGKVVLVTEVGYEKCRCEIGLKAPVLIPLSHLSRVA